MKLNYNKAWVGLVLLIMMMMSSANAAITYNYTGSDFININDPNDLISGSNKITGQVTLEAFPPGNFISPNAYYIVEFSFTDGVETLFNNSMNANASISGGSGIVEIISGVVSAWSINIFDSATQSISFDIASNIFFNRDESNRFDTNGSLLASKSSSTAGTWQLVTSNVTPVPTPSEIMMLGFGLPLIGFMVKQKRSV